MPRPLLPTFSASFVLADGLPVIVAAGGGGAAAPGGPETAADHDQLRADRADPDRRPSGNRLPGHRLADRRFMAAMREQVLVHYRL